MARHLQACRSRLRPSVIVPRSSGPSPPACSHATSPSTPRVVRSWWPTTTRAPSRCSRRHRSPEPAPLCLARLEGESPSPGHRRQAIWLAGSPNGVRTRVSTLRGWHDRRCEPLNRAFATPGPGSAAPATACDPKSVGEMLADQPTGGGRGLSTPTPWAVPRLLDRCTSSGGVGCSGTAVTAQAAAAHTRNAKSGPTSIPLGRSASWSMASMSSSARSPVGPVHRPG